MKRVIMLISNLLVRSQNLTFVFPCLLIEKKYFLNFRISGISKKMYKFPVKINHKTLLNNFKCNYIPVLCFYHTKYGTYGYKPDASPRYNPKFEGM